MEDYVYVSARKVERIAPTLPSKIRERLLELQVTLGPVGGGVKLADRPAAVALTGIAEVAREIFSQYRVKHYSDASLTPGDWFMGEGVPMVYGTVRDTSWNGERAAEAAAFGTRLHAHGADWIVMLVGSSENLVDRSRPPAEPGDSMSDPQAITRFLASHTEGDDTPDQYSLTDAYPMHNIYRELEHLGTYPLKFLARVLRVQSRESDFGDKSRSVLGTPLYVAHDVVGGGA